jgi:tetratricopeptide (TPR) repeat protein
MILLTRGGDAQTVRALVVSAFEARYHCLTELLSRASTAVAVAEEKAHALPGDLVTAAWVHYGNALRIAGQVQEAERALERAGARPATDLQTRVELLEVRAALHRNTGRLDSAASFLVAALEAQRPMDPSIVRTFNLLGLVALEAGDRLKALRFFHAALDLVGPATPVDIVASTGHNLVETLIAEGRLAAASAAMTWVEPYYLRLTAARLIAKAEWMRARLWRALRQVPAAQRAYERAHERLSTEPRSPELPDLVNEMAGYCTATPTFP